MPGQRYRLPKFNLFLMANKPYDRRSFNGSNDEYVRKKKEEYKEIKDSLSVVDGVLYINDNGNTIPYTVDGQPAPVLRQKENFQYVPLYFREKVTKKKRKVFLPPRVKLVDPNEGISSQSSSSSPSPSLITSPSSILDSQNDKIKEKIQIQDPEEDKYYGVIKSILGANFEVILHDHRIIQSKNSLPFKVYKNHEKKARKQRPGLNDFVFVEGSPLVEGTQSSSKKTAIVSRTTYRYNKEELNELREECPIFRKFNKDLAKGLYRAYDDYDDDDGDTFCIEYFGSDNELDLETDSDSDFSLNDEDIDNL